MTPLQEVENLLAAAMEDTQFRTVGSRAYFAAFNRVKQFSLTIGFAATRSGSDHQGLVSWLMSRKSNSLFIRIGRRLGDMRRLRNRADYDMFSLFTRSYADQLVQDAKTIDTWLSNLPQPAVDVRKSSP